MKREIKFRAWFPKGTDTGNGEIEKGEMCYDLAFEGYEPVNDLLNGVEHLMQFTGLKDKTAQEIYEGDILQGKPTVTGLKINAEVVFHVDSGRWQIKANKRFAEGLTVSAIAKMELCVIGNVHENPELLKQCR